MKKLVYALLVMMIFPNCVLAEDLHMLWNIPYTSSSEEVKKIVEEQKGITLEGGNNKKVSKASAELEGFDFLGYPVKAISFLFIDGTVGRVEIFDKRTDVDADVDIDTAIERLLAQSSALYVYYGEPTFSSISCVDGSREDYILPWVNGSTDNSVVTDFVKNEESYSTYITIGWKNFVLEVRISPSEYEPSYSFSYQWFNGLYPVPKKLLTIGELTNIELGI